MVERLRDRGRTLYQVYRLRDRSQPDSPENRETRGEPCRSYESALAYAQVLDGMEARG